MYRQAIFTILQLPARSLSSRPLCSKRLPVFALINSTRFSDVPISLPSTEGKLRTSIIQAASPEVLIDESGRDASSHPSGRVHCWLEVEGLLVIDKLVIYIAEVRATKTHDNIPALGSALVQPNHRLDYLQGCSDLIPPFRCQSRLRFAAQTMDRNECCLEKEVPIALLVNVRSSQSHHTYKT